MMAAQDYSWRVAGHLKIKGLAYTMSSMRLDLTQNAIPTVVCSFNPLVDSGESTVLTLADVLSLYNNLASLEDGRGTVDVHGSAAPAAGNGGQPDIGPTTIRLTGWPIMRIGISYGGGGEAGFSLTAMHPAWLALTSTVHMMGVRREFVEEALLGTTDIWDMIIKAMELYRSKFDEASRIHPDKLVAYSAAIAGLRKSFKWDDSARYPTDGMPRTTVIDWLGALGHSVKHAVMSAQEVSTWQFVLRLAQMYDFVVVPTYDTDTLSLQPFRPWSTPLDIGVHGWRLNLSAGDDQTVAGIAHNLRETGLDRLTTNPDMIGADSYKDDVIYRDPRVLGAIQEFGVPGFIVSATTHTLGAARGEAAARLASDTHAYPTPMSGQLDIGQGVAAPDDTRLWSELQEAAMLSAKQLYSEAYRRGQQAMITGPFRAGTPDVPALYPGMTVRMLTGSGAGLRMHVQRISHVLDKRTRTAQTEIVGAYACPEESAPNIIEKGANLYYGS